MPNTPVRAAAEGMSDYPRNSHRTHPFAIAGAFFRKVLMPWHARAKNAVVTKESVQESFMNQHVDRRALLASSAVAAAGVAAAVTSAGDVRAQTAQEGSGLSALIAAKAAAYARFDGD
ncbi:hypothetical protein ACWGS9_29505 [Bradyrhizobium sp. Arg314]